MKERFSEVDMRVEVRHSDGTADRRNVSMGDVIESDHSDIETVEVIGIEVKLNE